MLKLLAAAAGLCLLAACGNYGTVPRKAPVAFSTSQLAKSDIDRVAEAHQREIFGNLRLLAEKLYRRNPRELAKGNRTLAAEVQDLKKGTTAIEERARTDLGMVGKGETFYQVTVPRTSRASEKHEADATGSEQERVAQGSATDAPR